jgi:xanthine dehydrogenase accessory factor
MDDLLARAHELTARGEPFALATVVRVERPASARPGMKAIIRADGTLEGWVGGSCAHPIVVREALARLRDGAPRLISLTPHTGDRAEQEGVVHHAMTCHSGGSLEIYVEPVLPRPQLLLVGEAPLVSALARLARLEGFAVWVADEGQKTGDLETDLRLPLNQLTGRTTPDTSIVVATMGDHDEEALEQIAGAQAGYVGLVASRKRAETVFSYLRSRGLAAEQLERIRAPAGLDIGAVTPEEIALSIMAEVIQVRRSRANVLVEAESVPEALLSVEARAEAIDPICGMTVEIATAKHTFQHEGVTFYFCSAHCRQKFEREPARYATVGR